MPHASVIQRNNPETELHNYANEAELNRKLVTGENLFIDNSKVMFKKDFQKITFNHNLQKPIHRWTPYIQGFSSDFVE